MTPYEFTVYGTPAPAGSKKFAGMRGGHGVIIDASKKSRPWKSTVAQAAGDYMKSLPLLTGPVAASFTFYRRRPKYHYNSKGEVKRQYVSARPTPKPDVLKLARAVEDALSGICYLDDAQIVDETLAKFFGNPERVDISIREIT